MKSTKSKLSTKEMILYSIVSLNLLATIVLGVVVFKDMDYRTKQWIIQGKQHLLRDAKFDCMKDQGDVECKSVYDLEQQIQRLHEELL